MSRRLSFRLHLAAVLAALLVVTGAAVPANAVVYRTISGHVWLGDYSRSAVAGEVRVSLTKQGSSTGPLAFVDTDAAGNYSFSAEEGSYSLRFDYLGPERFGSLYWLDKPTGGPNDGNFQVGTFGVDAVRSIMLPLPHDVYGTVLEGSPPYAPVGEGDVIVHFERRVGATFTGIWDAPGVPTDASGQYALPDLVSGQYRLWFEYVGDGPNQSTGDFLAFSGYADREMGMILRPTLEISGKAYLGSPDAGQTLASTLAGAGDVRVSYAWRQGATDPWTPLGSVLTDATGTYLVPRLLDGYHQFTFEYLGDDGTYLPRVVEPGLLQYSYTNVDGTLTKVMSVSGHVQLQYGESLAAGQVKVERYSGGVGAPVAQTVYTNAAGNFTMAAVPQGDWVFVFTYLGSANYPAYTISRQIGRVDVTNLNATIPGVGGSTAHGTISGSVYDGSTSAVMTGDVLIEWTKYGQAHRPEDFVPVNSNGTFQITGLQWPASYYLYFHYVGTGSYNSYWYGNLAAREVGDMASGASIYLQSTNSFPINGYMRTPGSVGGTVTYRNGTTATAGEVTVSVRAEGTQTWTNSTTTNASGQYLITGLLPRRYAVRFVSTRPGFEQTWYWFTGKQPWPVTFDVYGQAGIVTKNVNIPHEGAIYGHVNLGTAALSAGVGDVTITAHPNSLGNPSVSTATTDVAGNFQLAGLDSEVMYYLKYTYVGSAAFAQDPINVSDGYIWVGDSQTVTIPVAQTVSGHIDVGFSGTSAGAGEVKVQLVGGSGRTTFTDANGDFSFTGLHYGLYTLKVDPVDDDWLQSVSQTTSGGSHVIPDIVLHRRTDVSGVVTDENGDPLSGVTVTMFRPAGPGRRGPSLRFPERG